MKIFIALILNILGLLKATNHNLSQRSILVNNQRWLAQVIALRYIFKFGRVRGNTLCYCNFVKIDETADTRIIKCTIDSNLVYTRLTQLYGTENSDCLAKTCLNILRRTLDYLFKEFNKNDFSEEKKINYFYNQFCQTVHTVVDIYSNKDYKIYIRTHNKKPCVAIIHNKAVIGNDFQWFGAVFIGESTKIYDGVHLYDGAVILTNSHIGPNVIIAENSIIGSFTTIGFGFHFGKFSIVGNNAQVYRKECFDSKGGNVKASINIQNKSKLIFLGDFRFVNSRDRFESPEFAFNPLNTMNSEDEALLLPESTDQVIGQ